MPITYSRLAAIIIVAIATHLILLAVIEPSSGGDGQYYIARALQLLSHGTFTDMRHPPLFTLLLSLLGGSLFALYLAQSLITIGLAAAVYRLSGSFVGGILMAACPFLAAYNYLVLSETLLFALLTVGWLLLERDRPVVAGVAIGLAILTRDTAMLLPLFALPFGMILKRGKQFAIMAVIAYAVVLPWPVYNAVNLGKFGITDGRFGFNLWIGTWEQNAEWSLRGYSPGEAEFPADAFRSPAEQQRILANYADDRIFREIALDRISTDPVHTIGVWFERYWRMWLGTRVDLNELRFEAGSPLWTAFKAAMWGLNLVLTACGLAAIFATRRWSLLIPVLYTAGVYLPFHSIETRFSLPALPFLLIALGWWLETSKAGAMFGLARGRMAEAYDQAISTRSSVE